MSLKVKRTTRCKCVDTANPERTVLHSLLNRSIHQFPPNPSERNESKQKYSRAHKKIPSVSVETNHDSALCWILGVLRSVMALINLPSSRYCNHTSLKRVQTRLCYDNLIKEASLISLSSIVSLFSSFFFFLVNKCQQTDF